MKRSRFTEQQIAYALQLQELGAAVDEICRKMGLVQSTFFFWKKRYAGLEPLELRRLKQLEEECAKLRRLVVDLSLDKAMPQHVVRRKL